MNNIINNNLIILGDNKHLIQFDRQFRTGGKYLGRKNCYSFRNLRNIPDAVDKEEFNRSIWCSRYWNCDDIDEVKKIKGITNLSNNGCYEFDTISNPPTELIRFMSGKFPTLIFVLSYKEEKPGGDGEQITYYQGALISIYESDCNMNKSWSYHGASDEDAA